LLAVTWSPQVPTSNVVPSPEPEKQRIPVSGVEKPSNVALRLTAVEGMTKLPLDKVGDYEFLGAM
jgi:hypothetical protein